MIFTNPQFLWGLLALLIPIVIHLFNFRKYKRVYFTNTRFLDSVIQEKRKIKNLKQILILCSRLLALFFLVMLFAQPVIPSKEHALDDAFVNLYLDNSLSSSSETSEGLTALEQGNIYLKKILNLYPKGTRFRLLTNDFKSESNLYFSKTKIEDLLTELEYSSSSREAKKVYQRLLKKNKAKDSYWISDFQLSTFADSKEFFENQQLNLKLIPLRHVASQNVFIDSVYLSSNYLSSSHDNRLKVKLKNGGTIFKDKVHLDYSINGQSQVSRVVEMDSLEELVLDFPLPKNLGDFNQGKITLDDSPIHFDNEYYFVVKKPIRIKVLEIKEKKKKTVIETVYSNQELFQSRSENIQNLNYDLIKQYDVIVLNEIRTFSSTILSVLNSQIQEGKPVVLVPSEGLDLEQYKKLNPEIVLFGDYENKQNKGLASINYKDPFFQGIFESETANFLMPSASPVLTSSRTAQTKLAFENGEPFLFEANNHSNLFLFTSPFLPEYTDFQDHSLFVPVMYNLASLSRGGQLPALAYNLDKPVDIFLHGALDIQKSLSLTKDEEKFNVYAQKNKNVKQLNLPKGILSNGFYNLESQGKLVDVLAFNSDAKESLLAQFTVPELEDEIEGNGSISIENHLNPEEFSIKMKEKYEGKELWFYALMISLLFLFIEVLLIRFFRFDS